MLHRLKTIEANKRLRPHMPRSMRYVVPQLRSVMRDLVDGKCRWPFYLHGNAGTGKTSACLALCDRIEFAGLFTVEELADDIMQGGCQLALAAQWADLLVVDELGTRQKPTDLHYQCLKQLIDGRTEAGKPATIFVSNVSPEKLSALYDERLASRILCGTCIKLDCEDRRFEL